MANRRKDDIREKVVRLIAKKKTFDWIAQHLSKKLGRRISPQVVSYYSKPVIKRIKS